MRRPDIPKKTSKEWSRLLSGALETIGKIAELPVATERVLLADDGGDVMIAKCSDTGGAVDLWYTPELKYAGEIHDELTGLVKDAIERKWKRIHKKGVMGVCPDVILALYDAYGYGDVEQAREAFSKIEGYDWLHSIYWAASFADKRNILHPDSPGRSGVFLFSKEQNWT
jgi:hypothetical protein